MSHCDMNPLVLLLSFNEIKPSLFTYIVSPASIPPRDIYSMCVCVEWSLVSVYRREILASWHVTRDVPHCGLPLWDPRGRVVEARQPPSPGGPRRPQRALGRWSLQRFSSLIHKQRRGGANAGGGTGPGPHPRCQEKAETLTKPCWEGAGPEQVQPQPPLSPLCQHLSGGAHTRFLSSLLLIHTLERCCRTTSSPSLHPATNPDTEKKNHNQRVQQ